MSRGAAKSKKGAPGSARGSLALRRGGASPRRRQRAAPYTSAFSAQLVPLLPLAVAAAGLPLFVWHALGDEIAMPRLAATAWLTGCSLVALSVTGAWSRVRWRSVAVPLGLLGAFLGLSVISTAVGADPVRSLLGEYQRYQGLLPLLLYGALMLAALAATAYAGTSRPLLIGVCVGGTLAAAYGFIQWAGLDWVTWGGLPAGQIGGAFAQPEVLGIELVAAAAASTGLLPDTRGRWRAAVIGGIALMLFVTFLTLSRGAFVGAGIAAVVLVVLNFDTLRSWRSRWWYALPAVAVLGAMLVAIPQGRDSLNSGWRRVGSVRDFGQTATSQRLGLWRLSLEMTQDHPLVGSGPDSFPQLFASYRNADQPGYGTNNVRPESSHNLLLDRLVDGGALGFAAFIGMLAATAWLGLRALRRLDGAARVRMAALLAALAGYYAAASFFFAEPMTGWLPWLFLGAVAGVASTVTGEEPATPRSVDAARSPAPEVPRWAIPVPAAAAAFGVVLVAAGLWLVIADLYSRRAFDNWQSSQLAAAAGNMGTARTELAAAAGDMGTASHINPLQPQYLLALGSYRQGAAAQGQAEFEPKALAAFHTLNTRFQPTAVGLVREAETQANVAFNTPAERERVFDLLERAARLDPYNADLRRGIAGFYDQVGEQGRAAPHRQALAAMGADPGGGGSP